MTPSLRITRIQQAPPALHMSSDCYFAVLRSEASRVWTIPAVMLDEFRRGSELNWEGYSSATPLQRANSTTGDVCFALTVNQDMFVVTVPLRMRPC